MVSSSDSAPVGNASSCAMSMLKVKSKDEFSTYVASHSIKEHIYKK